MYTGKQKEMRISFPDHVMKEIYDLASTYEHGSAHTIIKKAVSQFLKTVNSASVEYGNIVKEEKPNGKNRK